MLVVCQLRIHIWGGFSEGRDEGRGKETGLPDGAVLAAVCGRIVASSFGNVGTQVPSCGGEYCTFIFVVATHGWLVAVFNLVYVVVEGCDSTE